MQAYVPMAGARSVEDLLPYTEGAAIVKINAVARTYAVDSDRHPATAEDVAEARRAGKPLKEGELTGQPGILQTAYAATVVWLDGRREEAEIVFTGGVVDGVEYRLEGMPLPEVGHEYFYFLRHVGPGGQQLLAEAIQFEIIDGKLVPTTFEGSPLALEFEGRTVAEVSPEILATYAAGPVE